MKRVALTIILNGKHHLEHQNFTENMLQWFDYWAVVEGAANSTGSTAWCLDMPDEYHQNGGSVDGTREIMQSLAQQHDHLLYIPSNGFWENKDAMCNAGLAALRQKTSKAWLWQVDVDEVWTEEKLIRNEQAVERAGAKMGKMRANHFVGDGLVARGEWGSGHFYRLWNWKGEDFATHEPPELVGGNGHSIECPEWFDHYSYYFEQDVRFKDQWYSEHQGVYDGWKSLKNETHFPQPIKRLFPHTEIGHRKARIVRYP